MKAIAVFATAVVASASQAANAQQSEGRTPRIDDVFTGVGGFLLSAGYGSAAIAGVAGAGNGQGTWALNFIPIAGPLITVIACQDQCRLNTDSIAMTTGLVVNTVAQAAGLTFLVLGLGPMRSREQTASRVALVPWSTGQMAGLALTGVTF